LATSTIPDRDLHAPDRDGWRSLRVPRGWSRVARLCREMHEDLPSLTATITAVIEDTVPGYAASAVPRHDLERSVERNVADLLLGIAERRDPTPEEVERRAALGARRAAQGLPVDTLMQAFHVGYRELWEQLVRRAGGFDTDLSPRLLQASTTMWTWTHQITDALGHTHAETLRTLALQAASVRQRFLELVLSGDHETEEAITLARGLEFDTAGPFRAHVARTAVLDGSEVPRIQTACEALAGNQQVISQGARLVVLAQDEGGLAVGELLAGQLPEATVGVGLQRTGLDGARLSVGDAERALALTDRPRVIAFEDVWPWALLARDLDRARPLLEGAVRTAQDHAHLAEAVLAYARSGSIADAGRSLGVHPNTVTYRLERWGELSGWDARDFDGLLRSVIALRLPR
jgi:hypothetical protein